MKRMIVCFLLPGIAGCWNSDVDDPVTVDLDDPKAVEMLLGKAIDMDKLQ
jgi:hypothetical protein